MDTPTNGSRSALLSDLALRELGKINRTKFQRKSSGNRSLIQRLKLFKCLEGHSGCVNSTYFSPGGDYLISGSDDRDIIVWKWQEGEVCFRYPSGHSNNVFQAKAMPNTEEKTIVTCAADGQVRYGVIQDGGGISTSMLGRHRGRTHKLAIEPGSPYNFFSCGEDGVVGFFDLRHARQDFKLLTCTSLEDTPTRYLGSVGLTSIAINPSIPYQFAVAGYDQFARVYDMRKLFDTHMSDSKRLLDTFAASHFVTKRHGIVHSRLQSFITGIAYSPQQELAVSYSDEHIYLFDRTSGLGSDPFAHTSLQHASHPSSSVPLLTSSSTPSIPSPPTPMVFKGHSNSMTIKGVSFFGENADYVMSGSECGSIFIWDKADGTLVRKFRGDTQVVNSLESHPHGCFLVSSGIDYDIKVWMPNANIDELPSDDLSVDHGERGNLRQRFQRAFNHNFIQRDINLNDDEISPLWIDLLGDALARNINGVQNVFRVQIVHDDSEDGLDDGIDEDDDDDDHQHGDDEDEDIEDDDEDDILFNYDHDEESEEMDGMDDDDDDDVDYRGRIPTAHGSRFAADSRNGNEVDTEGSMSEITPDPARDETTVSQRRDMARLWMNSQGGSPNPNGSNSNQNDSSPKQSPRSQCCIS